jgi:hypothetical protein
MLLAQWELFKHQNTYSKTNGEVHASLYGYITVPGICTSETHVYSRPQQLYQGHLRKLIQKLSPVDVVQNYDLNESKLVHRGRAVCETIGWADWKTVNI